MPTRMCIEKHMAMLKGKSRYFTGKPCKYGHLSDRYVDGSRCVECARISSKLQYKKKKEDPVKWKKELKRAREYYHTYVKRG